MKKIPVRQLSLADVQQASFERFKIRTVEEILEGRHLRQDLHRHDFFFILLLQKGKGGHEIDFKKYDVSDHSVFLLRPGQVHQLELKAGCTGYLMEFDSGFYQPTEKLSVQLFRKACNKNFCKPEAERFESLHSILKNIYKEYTSLEEGYLNVIKANLEIFFIEFVRQSSQPGNALKTISFYTQERLEEFLELLEKHIFAFKQVSHYTDLMNLSTYQLNEITKTTIAKTPSQLINEHIILEAKRQLLATTNQIKDIADHLGYEDVSYFIRFFKKHTGQTPEVFRQNFA